MRIRKHLSIAFVCLLVVIAAACGSSYDEEGFGQVRAWAEDAVGAAQMGAITAAAYPDDDAVGDEDLESLIDELDAVYDRADDLPDNDEIEGWQANLSQGGREWQLDGPALAAAVEELQSAIGWLADDATAVVNSGPGQIDHMLDSAEDAYVAADYLSAVLTGQQ